jgi:prepilin-type N-terminal cleavage/methylation domain-containing protein
VKRNISAPLKSILSLAGFTLIEMLLVVMIVAIISVLSVPRFSKAHQGIILKKQADDIVYLMRYAQSRAINKNKLLQFLFSEEFSSYRILEAESNDYREISDATFIPFQSRLARVRKINSRNFIKSDLRYIHFYPDGQIDRLSFEVCNENKCFAVSTEFQRGNINLLGPVENE